MLAEDSPRLGNPNLLDASFYFSFSDGTQLADSAMELHELLGRESLRPLQYLARALILPHLHFLFVGQRQDTQRENLIDLRAIEERPRAFRGNLGIVIQDDGRRKHCIAFSLVTDQHRPRADILTFLDKSLQLFRWLQQRNEGTLTYL